MTVTVAQRTVPARVLVRGDVISFEDPDGIQSHDVDRVEWVERKLSGIDVGLASTWMDRQGDPTSILHLLHDHQVVLYELKIGA